MSLLTVVTVLRAKASPYICICVQDAIRWLQAAVARVSAAGVLSSNEEVDDIPTADLKFLLLPYMQGYLLSDSRERNAQKGVWSPCKKQAVTLPGEHAASGTIVTGSLYIITAICGYPSACIPHHRHKLRMQTWLEKLHDPPQPS